MPREPAAWVRAAGATSDNPQGRQQRTEVVIVPLVGAGDGAQSDTEGGAGPHPSSLWADSTGGGWAAVVEKGLPLSERCLV